MIKIIELLCTLQIRDTSLVNCCNLFISSYLGQIEVRYTSMLLYTSDAKKMTLASLDRTSPIVLSTISQDLFYFGARGP